MLTVFTSISPVVLIAGLGYLAAVRKLLLPADIDGLSRFVFTLALPFLLFDSLVNAVWPATFDWTYLIAFYSASYLIFALGVIAARAWFHLSPLEQGAYGLGAAYSNLVLVGLPVIKAGLGEQAVLPLLVLVSVQNLLLFPLVSLVAHPREPGSKLLMRIWRPIAHVAANPLMIGLTLGFLFKVLSITLPPLLADPVHLVAQAGLPCALIMLGASFHRYEVGRPNLAAVAMVGFKILLHPALVWVLVFPVLHLDPLWGVVAVLAAGMPTGINAYVMAEQMHAGQRFVSASIWISTLLAIATQAGMLAFFISQGYVQ
jgi:malonate transporter